jgi:hypothetical protein
VNEYQDDWRRRNPGCGGRRGCFGCGSGCGSFLFVLILGGALSVFDLAFSIGFSVRIPFTPSNFTAAGSIGTKEKAVDALPAYAESSFGENVNFINQSSTLTVGPAQGVGLLVLGEQRGAPEIDLYVDLQ